MVTINNTLTTIRLWECVFSVLESVCLCMYGTEQKLLLPVALKSGLIIFKLVTYDLIKAKFNGY